MAAPKKAAKSPAAPRKAKAAATKQGKEMAARARQLDKIDLLTMVFTALCIIFLIATLIQYG